VLARLKQDLGVAGLASAAKKIAEAENINNAGDYFEAAARANDVISIVDRLSSGALTGPSLENVRESARAMGDAMANLPLPFGQENQKLAFSDLPPSLKNLVKSMIPRVEARIGQKEANEAVKPLRDFMSGGALYNQSELSAQMSTLLRLLT
jgi:hypothetical protein